ncbi:unnamed protein product [Mortierella alpina]
MPSKHSIRSIIASTRLQDVVAGLRSSALALAHSSTIHRPDFRAQLPRQGCHTRTFTLIGSFDSVLRDLVFASCPQLSSLDLTLAKSLDQAGILLLVQCLPRLRALRLNSCVGQELAWLSSLHALSSLQELDFVASAAALISQDQDQDQDQDDPVHDFGAATWSVSSAAVSVESAPDHLGSFLVARTRTLLRLNLEGSDLQGFELFRDPHKGLGKPRLLPRTADSGRQILALRHLSLSEITVSSTGFVVEPLLRQCPDLEHLDLSGNFDEAWSSFQWPILQSHCLNLKSLNVSKMSSVDNSQLVEVINSCTGLDTLVAAQSNIASEVLQAIVERVCGHAQSRYGGSPFLELDVSWCSDVSNAALQQMAELVPTLQSLKFSWCPQVDLSIFQGQWTCVGLKVLEAQGLDRPAPLLATFDLPWELCLFQQVSRLECLLRLAIGSNEMVVSEAHGFNMATLQSLRQLQSFELVGNEDSPLGLPEMQALASALVSLERFHFGLGLVDKKMQSWLAGARPDIEQMESQYYY